MATEHEKKLALVASLMEDAIHSIAHKEVHRQVSELRESVVFNAQRLTEMDKEVKDNSDTLDSVEAHHKVFLAGVRQEMHQAIAEMTNPDDERMAKVEKRVHRLEEQMTQLIELLGQAVNLE